MLLKEIAQELEADFSGQKNRGPFYKLNYHIWKNLCDAFEGKRKNCWAGSFSPFEIAPMFDDMMNIPIELVISNSARFGKNSDLIDLGAEALECREICSCLRGVTGGITSGQYPEPDVLLRSSHFCLGGDKTFDIAVEKYNVPYYLINVPLNDIPGAVDYVARQLENTFRKMEDYLGIKVTQTKIEDVFENVNNTYKNFSRINQLMMHIPSPATEDVYWSPWMFSFIMGSKEAVEISQDIIDVIEKNIETKNFEAPEEKYRILLQGWPWIDNPITKWVRAHKDVSIIWNLGEYGLAFGYLNIAKPLDAKDPFKSMADKLVQHAMVTRRYPDLFFEGYYQLLRGLEIDGIIATMPWACMIGQGSEPSMKNFYSRRGFPYLDLGVDCYDKREFNTQRIQKDVELFLSTITQKKAA